MKKNALRRILGLMLAVAMVLSVLPVSIFAADSGQATYTKVTEESQLTDGQYVLVDDSDYAPTVLGDKWVGYVEHKGEPTDQSPRWTITLGDRTVSLTDANGVSIAPKGGNNNGIQSGDYNWDYTFENGTFVFKGTGSDTVTLALNISNNGSGYRAYKNSSASNYPHNFTLYKVEDASTEEPGADHVVINQVYGGGGNSGATLKNDFIELYNPTNKDVSLEGWSVQYASATGNFSSSNTTALSGTIKAKGYYLIQEAKGNGGSEDLPTPDAEGTIGLSASNFKVALANSTETVTGLEAKNVVDFVGAGTANTHEGAGAAPAPSNTTAIIRDPEGKDTDDNAADFKTAAPNPRNSSNTVKPEEPDDPTIPANPVKESHIATSLEEVTSGSKVVIYNKDANIALSQTYSGNYNAGVSVKVEGTKVTGFGSTEIWTVIKNSDDTYSFQTADGQKLSMDTEYTSMPLGKAYDKWAISTAQGSGYSDCYNIKNPGRNATMEWFASKNYWSAYYSIASGSEGLFAQQFYLVADADVPGGAPEQELPIKAGDKVFLYNVGSKGVVGIENDTESLESASAELKDNKATAGNKGVLFTVQQHGEWFRFYNEEYGYMASDGTGNNAYLVKEGEEHYSENSIDWKIAPETRGTTPGYTLESREAKFNGQYSQYMEYFGGVYKTYSMYNITSQSGYDIYVFNFYPAGNQSDDFTNDVVNLPEVEFVAMTDAMVGMDYTFSFNVSAVFGVKEDALTVTIGTKTYDWTEGTNGYTVTVPTADIPSAETMTITVNGKDLKDKDFTASYEVKVMDEPSIANVTPAQGAETKDNKRPTISADIINGGQNPTVTMKVNGEDVEAKFDGKTISYTPTKDMEDGRVTVSVTVKRADGKEATKTWNFTVGEAGMQLYFGQLHAHTTVSDGSGSVADALQYLATMNPESNVDFIAITDHSNYFDNTSAANPEAALYDTSLMTAASAEKWNTFQKQAEEFNKTYGGQKVILPGFEMTWSGGPGHINTWNTPGVVSRNNSTLNNKTSDAGMKAYYALLSNSALVDSISQFNHPGTTFGNFTDFSYWDAMIDTRMYLVEVGNGEGAIGSGGYFPSYEQYTLALDKGWHVAPTNNQDNHRGRWGNANDARDVILAEDFSVEGLYAAIRQYRVYATEDKNLEITYTVNDQQLGSQIVEVPEKLNLAVTVYDPDANDSISKVEVIVNSGKVAYTWDDPAQLASGNLTATLDPDYSYYYIRVTQGDGDLAVTAPVWVGETLKLGITSLTSDTAMPVTNESLTLTTTLFNSESTDATLKSLTFTTNGSVVIGQAEAGGKIPANGTLAVNFKYTPTEARVITITATAVVEMDGKEYTFSQNIELDVLAAEDLLYIGFDASHYNEYVSGNYADSMGNFAQLAGKYNLRTAYLKTSEDLIKACANSKYKMIVLTAPSRRLTAAQQELKSYTEEEIAAIKRFNEKGGVVILTGWSDYYEGPEISGYSDYLTKMTEEQHMAAEQNKILEALGSSLRMGDDATMDETLNGGQSQRLYFNTYNFDNFLNEGVEVDPDHPNDRIYTEVFSHYGGSSIFATTGSTLPDTVSPMVYGHASTYSKDQDGDGKGGDDIPLYDIGDGDKRLLITATEQIGEHGLIIVSGGAFMSNFEVQAKVEDSNSEKNYSNYRICENLLKWLNPPTITDIAEVQKQTETGYKYTIEGIVTSNASGYDQRTAFFDCIYVQDATGGINCFPVAGNFKIGDKVRVTGTTDFYQGELELQVSSIEVIGEEKPVEPTDITAKELNDRTLEGSLVRLSGTITYVGYAEGKVQTILVKDAQGNVGRVFIDGYITSDIDVKNAVVGATISAVGLASYDDTFNETVWKGESPSQGEYDGTYYARIRVRNREDVVCSLEKHTVTVDKSENGTVTASGTEFLPGETVTLTVTPNKGYTVDIVTVTTASGAAVKVTLGEDGKYTFPMPGENVKVTVTFKVITSTDPAKPTQPGGDGPAKTGDDFSFGLMACLMVISLMGVAVLTVYRKRTER